VTALVVSGLPTDSFIYLGFLPRRRKDRRQMLDQVAAERRTLIAFEAPHRLKRALEDIEEILGDRPMAACRELTKLHEEVVRGTVRELRSHYEETEPRGEFTLVLGGAAANQAEWSAEAVEQAFAGLLEQGMSRPEAAKEVAALSGWRRSEVYRLGLDGVERTMETRGPRRNRATCPSVSPCPGGPEPEADDV
jgi:16S rRNA (cytidine1402-2'-O)-methyltransferase